MTQFDGSVDTARLDWNVKDEKILHDDHTHVRHDESVRVLNELRDCRK